MKGGVAGMACLMRKAGEESLLALVRRTTHLARRFTRRVACLDHRRYRPLNLSTLKEVRESTSRPKIAILLALDM